MMAKYQTQKFLSDAIPTVRTADNLVKSWDLKVTLSYNGFAREYGDNINVLYMQKTVDQFTKADLMGLLNMPQMEAIFEAHYEAATQPPAETRLQNFDITQIPES
jgi:ABC-type antimicrobial peptide transport system ATPase subunit